MSGERLAVGSAASLAASAGTTSERRILLALMAFAAGDAYGVPYEYLPNRIPVDLEHIGGRQDWPAGGVSDDTLLSLLTIGALRAGDPPDSAQEFLRATREALPTLRGLGPTTRHALGLPPAIDEGLVVVGEPVLGATNGAMMRTALVGLGYRPGRDGERRSMVAALARATHPAPKAVASAVLCSALYSRSLERPAEPVPVTLRRELAAVEGPIDELRRWVATPDDWTPPADGISLDPLETLAAVVWIVRRAADPLAAFGMACEIGGDTDTVAALAGGLACARQEVATLLDISWIDDVRWREIPHVAAAALTLAEMRARP